MTEKSAIDTPRQRWDWNKLIPSWLWHQICLDEYPAWEKEEDGNPASVFIRVEHPKDKSSRTIAIEFDDLCHGAFYYRDFTEDGIPFIRDGDVYHARFWFQFKSDADMFLTNYGGDASKQKTPQQQ